jgi:hypothetical protein
MSPFGLLRLVSAYMAWLFHAFASNWEISSAAYSKNVMELAKPDCTAGHSDTAVSGIYPQLLL